MYYKITASYHIPKPSFQVRESHLKHSTAGFLALDSHEIIVFAHVDVELLEALHVEHLLEVGLEADLLSSPSFRLPLLEGG